MGSKHPHLVVLKVLARCKVVDKEGLLVVLDQAVCQGDRVDPVVVQDRVLADKVAQADRVDKVTQADRVDKVAQADRVEVQNQIKVQDKVHKMGKICLTGRMSPKKRDRLKIPKANRIKSAC